MKVLGIETSCDETAAAVFTDELKILSNVVASQAGLHERWRSEQGAWLEGDELVRHHGGDERRIPRSALKLQGNANVENALAAWLAARAVGVEDVDVQIAFGTFAGLPHRMVLVREVDGVRWINDSKGTNVDATLKSLEGFGPSSVILILGVAMGLTQWLIDSLSLFTMSASSFRST